MKERKKKERSKFLNIQLAAAPLLQHAGGAPGVETSTMRRGRDDMPGFLLSSWFAIAGSVARWQQAMKERQKVGRDAGGYTSGGERAESSRVLVTHVTHTSPPSDVLKGYETEFPCITSRCNDSLLIHNGFSLFL